MTTPSGQIAISDVNIELKLAASRANSTLNDAPVRTLAGISSGQISLSSLRSKSNTFTLTIGDHQNSNLRTIANAGGYALQPKVHLILVGTQYSYSTGTPACVVGVWPNGTALTVELQGTIQAYGGLGAGGGINGAGGLYGSAGGYALQFNAGIPSGSITFYINGGYVYGGGGGGGGGGSGFWFQPRGGDSGGICAFSSGGNGGNGQGFGIAQSGGVVGGTSAGSGGSGGGWGAGGSAGGSGTSGQGCSGSYPSGGSGGAAGYAYLGWANVNSYTGNTTNYTGLVG